MSCDMVSTIFEMLSYDGIQYLDESNISLPKKFPSRQGTLIWFWPKLSNLMFHDSFSDNFFEILWHNGVQCIDKSNVSQISPQKVFLEQYGPSLVQNYTTCSNCSRDFKKYFIAMEFNS